MKGNPYDVILWRKVKANRRMIALIEYAERKSGVRITPVQGGYKTAGNRVKASGSTHNGSAIDGRTWNLTTAELNRFMRAFKDAGGVGWIRTQADGFDPHMHLLARADKDLAASAAWQVREYDAGRNGLTNGRKDRYPYRTTPKVRFSYLQGKPVPA